MVGIAGGEAKCRWLLDEARLDAAIDYRNSDVATRLRDVCPDGVDVQDGFENIPATFLRLFTGANEGKQLLKL